MAKLSSTQIYGNLYVDNNVVVMGTIDGSIKHAVSADNATNATNAVNADKVDNLHASSFLRTDADSSLNGGKALQINHGTRVVRTGQGAITGGGDAASSTDANLRIHSWYGVGFAPTIANQTVPQGENATWINVRTGNVYTRGNYYAGSDKPVWHSGNLTFGTGNNNMARGDHTHSYLPLSGGTMTGPITTPNNAQGIKVGDDAVICDRNIANHIVIEGSTATSGGITFGSGKDTNIYRGGANLLKTDDTFNAVGGFQWNGQSLDSRYSDKSLNKNSYTRITVNGDANTYYPVLINFSKTAFPYAHLNISRSYNWAAPDTWNNATHRGGLTLSIRWTGDSAWGGNDKNIIVDEFSESYSTMVAGLTLSTSGLIVWLRGGGALYQLDSEYGVSTNATITLGSYTASDNTVYGVRTNTDNVTNEIRKRWMARGTSGVYDNNNRVYSASNKPSPADIGAAPSSHGHSNMLTFKSNHTSDWTSSSAMSGKTYMGGWHGTLTSGTTGYVSLGASGSNTLDLMIDGDIYVRENSKVYHSGNKPSAADIGAAPTSHNHGLLHDNLTVTIPNTTNNNGWSMINSSYNGFLLKSIRGNSSAPEWFVNNYSAGVAFGGADTKGVMSVAYNTPSIKIAGGNGSSPVWWLGLTGTSKKTYNMDSLNAATANKLTTARSINGTNFDGTANITTANWGTARTITIGSTGKSVNGSGNVTWTHNEMKVPRTNINYGFGGNQNAITTAQFITLLTNAGAFEQQYWISRGSWHYAGNQYINDTGCGNIHLAGCTIEVIGTTSTYTVRIHTPTTSASGVTNGDFIYVNNGTDYSPGWRRIYNNKYKPTASDVGALPLAGSTMTGPIKFNSNATSNDVSAPTQLAYGLLGSYGNLKILANTDNNAGADNEYVHIAAARGLSPATNQGIVVYGTYANAFGSRIVTEASGIANTAKKLLNYKCTIGGTNTNQYHRIATSGVQTGNYVDKSAIVLISQQYNGGSYAIVRFDLRTNNASDGAGPNFTCNYLVNKGFASDAFQMHYNATAANTFVDIYYKCPGTHCSINMYLLSNGGRGNPDGGFTFYNTTYDNAMASPTPSVSGRSYTGSTTCSYADATVNRAVRLHTARSINGTNFDGTGNITTANWGTARTITVGKTGKSVNGSGNVSWSLSEIGAMGATNANGYWGLTAPDGNTSNWIRTTTNGIIPYQSGGASALGTSSWPFSNAYINTVYGNLSGNASTATTSNYLGSNTRMDYGWNGINYFNISGTAGTAVKANNTPTTAWWHIMRFNHANSSGYYTDLAVPFNHNSLYYKVIRNGGLANNGWVKVLDSLNYNEYSPTKTGGGASGTWGISVSGNAATATKLQTARSINGTSFDGTGNITTANWGTARTLTIGNTGKSVNGSGNVSWSVSEIGAVKDTEMFHGGNDLNTYNSTRTWTCRTSNTTSNRPADWYTVLNVGASYNSNFQIAGHYGNTTTPRIYVRTRHDTTGNYSNWAELWNTKNAPNVLREAGSNTQSNWNNYTAGVYRIGYDNWSGISNAPTGAYTYGTLVVYVSGNSATQCYYPHYGEEYMWTRTKWNASDWRSWDRVLLGSQLATGSSYKGKIANIGTNGVMEIGQYIDMHNGSSTADYTTRLESVAAQSTHVLRVTNNQGWGTMGPENGEWCHFNTDRPKFYFSKKIEVNGHIGLYNSPGQNSKFGYDSSSGDTFLSNSNDNWFRLKANANDGMTWAGHVVAMVGWSTSAASGTKPKGYIWIQY